MDRWIDRWMDGQMEQINSYVEEFARVQLVELFE